MFATVKNVIKNKLIPLCAIACTINTFSMEQPQSAFNLMEYDYKSASVLPLYKGSDDKLYVILSREARGKDKYTYDDFSGGREDQENALISAAREFHEEAILQNTLNWSLEDTIDFLNPECANNTIAIVACSKNVDSDNPNGKTIKNVTYIVSFDQYATTLFNNFYDAIAIEKKHYAELGICKGKQCTTEKDRIAFVLLEDFIDAIVRKKKHKPVHIKASIIDPKNPSYIYKEQITLRPFLAIKLRPYFLDQPYESGENNKIKHYKIDAQ